MIRLINFRKNNQDGQHRIGAVLNGKVVELKKESSIKEILKKHPDDLYQYMEEEISKSTTSINSSGNNTSYKLDEMVYAPVVPDAEKYICIGVNYAKRNEEYDDSSLPKKPSLFMRSRESFVGHRQSIMIPPESNQLDYEGEIVLVVGKTGRRIGEEVAHEYVAGVTLMNEGSIRDWLRHGKFNVTQGKNFTASGSLGPEILIEKPTKHQRFFESLQVKTEVNGELRQDGNTVDLLFDFRFLISYLSTFYTLQPGDVIATGTPTGAGTTFDPPKFLLSGDRVRVSLFQNGEQLIELNNPVKEEF